MNETATAARIVADTAGLPHQCAVAQPFQWNVRELHVDGSPEYMLAAYRNMPANPLEKGVGFRRSEAADDSDRHLRAKLLVQFPHQINGFVRHADEAAAPPIAHEIVELSHRGRNVLPVALIGDRQRFAGVNMIELKGPQLARPGRIAGQTEQQRSPHRRDGSMSENSIHAQAPRISDDACRSASSRNRINSPQIRVESGTAMFVTRKFRK